MRGLRLSPACLAALAALAACVPRATAPPPQPAPPPRPAPLPAPAPPSPPQPAPAAWQDAALAPGDWHYAEGQASFASPGGPLFALRCDAGRQIRIIRTGVPGGPITIVTTLGERTASGSGNDAQALATLPASDPLFDQIAFSRGRFLVRTAGGGDLILPSWPEPARLVEECRGQSPGQ